MPAPRTRSAPPTVATSSSHRARASARIAFWLVRLWVTACSITTLPARSTRPPVVRRRPMWTPRNRWYDVSSATGTRGRPVSPPATATRSTSRRAAMSWAVILVRLVALSPVAWAISARAGDPSRSTVCATSATLRRRSVVRSVPRAAQASAEDIGPPQLLELGPRGQTLPVARAGDVERGDGRRGGEGLLHGAAGGEVGEQP